jgi:hypothetical protein
MPGSYTVKLTAGGKTYTQPMTVKMDPQVKTSAAELAQQFALSKQLYDDALAAGKATEEIRAARRKAAGTDFDKQALGIEGERAGRFGGRSGAVGTDTLGSVSGSLVQLMNEIQDADVAPTAAEVGAVSERRAAVKRLLDRWEQLKRQAKP